MDVGKSLLDRLPVGIGIVDENGEVLFMNKHLQGLAGTNLLGEKCWQYYRDDKTQCRDCPLRNGIFVNGIKTLESSGVFGSRTYQIGHFGMVMNGKKALLEVFTDITERKSLERQLHHASKMESLGTLAGGVAHDFNNILAIIQGHVDLLKTSHPESETHAKSLDAIATATGRGTSLVQQLLRFARKTDVTLEPVSVNEAIREIVSLLHQTFPRTIDIVTELDPDIPWLVADATELHQVLLNLCVNARDAMPEGGRLTLSTHTVSGEGVRAQFPSANTSRYVSVEIADTGTGMDERLRQRIFDPFFSTKGIGKGTGLGLATAYGIVQSHSGFIDVHSEVGRGTTFRLFLPSERTTRKIAMAPGPMNESQGGTETILVVEDEEALREIAVLLLSNKGYTVLTAKDGAEAIDVYQQHSAEINLVITDLGLPVVGGDQLARTLMKMNSSLDLIVASGYVDPETKSALSRSGVKEFVQKPYQQDELLAAIRKVLDRHGTKGPVRPAGDLMTSSADPGPSAAISDVPAASFTGPGKRGIVLAILDNIVQLGVREILLSSPEFQVHDEALTADDLQRAIAKGADRLFIIDNMFCRRASDDFLSRLKEQYPGIHVLLLCEDADNPSSFRAADHGMSCFLLSDSAEAFRLAVQDAAAGRQYLSEGVSQIQAKDSGMRKAVRPDELLSERERAVFRLTALGKSTKEISSMLGISIKTVSTYRTRILKKLGLESTASLIAYAIRHNIVR